MRTRDEEKRARILDSTSKIMMEQGIAAVSLSKIAKDAGIASGTVYTYFKDKDDLLRGVYYDRKKRVAEAINSIDLNGDPVEQLTHFMDLVYDYGQNHLEDMLLIREFNQSPLLSQLNIDVKVAYAGFEPLLALSKKGIQEQKFVPDADTVLMSYAYTPVIEYLLAVRNGALDSKNVPFANVKALSLRAIVKWNFIWARS